MMETFLYSKCYEWVIVLAIVLKKFSAINDVIRLVKIDETSAIVADSIKKGIDEINLWASREW